MIEDAELLRCYVETHSEAAFAELVGRRIGLVYSVALRTTRDAQRAEDVTQTVFADLARKATSLSNRAVLAGWLFRSAHFAALGLVRAERNRTAREWEAQTMLETLGSEEPSPDWEKVRPALDQVMSELSERDRDAIMLRFFDGRPFADIGARLQLTENSARMRVERALAKLHALLAMRGVTSTSSALAALLANQAAAVVPAGLAASVTGVALSGTAAAGAGGLTALWSVLSASKVTVSFAAVAALGITTAVLQLGQARTAAMALAADTKEHAVLRARLAELETQAQASNRALTEQDKTADQLAKSKLSTAAPVADDEIAKQQRALQDFLDRDPEVRKLKLESNRAWQKAELGPFLRSIGLAPEQVDQVVEAKVHEMAFELDQRAAGLPRPKAKPTDEMIRGLFGNTAAERFAEYMNTWREGQIVSELSAALVYAGEPFTVQQAKRLAEILLSAKMNKDPAIDQMARYDWDRILVEAEPVLSPVQLLGLRAQAAIGRMEAQFAAEAKTIAAAPKP